MRKLTRHHLADLPCETLRQGNAYKADLLLYDVGGERVLLKDYGGKRGMWREALGVLGTLREAVALRALAGVEGVPQFRGRPDRYSVAMTYLPGRQPAGGDPELTGDRRFVDAFDGLVRTMHARGVVHLDLQHRSNLQVSSAGMPIVLDFESALCFDPGCVAGRLALRMLGVVDRMAVQKWKRRLCPDMLNPAERRGAELWRRARKWWLPRRVMDAVLRLAVRDGKR